MHWFSSSRAERIHVVNRGTPLHRIWWSREKRELAGASISGGFVSPNRDSTRTIGSKLRVLVQVGWCFETGKITTSCSAVLWCLNSPECACYELTLYFHSYFWITTCPAPKCIIEQSKAKAVLTSQDYFNAFIDLIQCQFLELGGPLYVREPVCLAGRGRVDLDCYLYIWQ